MERTKEDIKRIEKEIMETISDIPYSLEQKYIDDGIQDIFIESLVTIHSQIEIKMEQELFLLRIISATSQFLSANIAVSSFFNCGL